MQHDNIYAVIPAYNAAKTLQSVIMELREVIPGIAIVVVDDGSSDATSQIAANLGVKWVQHHRNLGKGAALKRGFHEALSGKARLIFTLDADGQHNPREAIKLLDKIERENLDVVIGSRMTNLSVMPIPRIISNITTSKLISWRIKQNADDSQSGFRLYREETLKGMDVKTNHFDFESELLIKIGQSGFKVGSVAIETIYTSNGVSSIRLIDIFRFTMVYLRSFFWQRKLF